MSVPLLFANNASSRLYAGIDPASPTLRVEQGDGAKFPVPPIGSFFMVTVEDRRTGQLEICKCTANLNDILTIQRGQEGTVPQAFDAGATVSNRLTAGTLGLFATYTPGTAYVSDTPPILPMGNGSLWWESDSGNLYVWYNDGNSSQWVQITGPTGTPGPEGPVGPTGTVPLLYTVGDETTPITLGDAKFSARFPYALTLSGVRASLTEAQASGTVLTVDLKWLADVAWVSALQTRISFDNGETTSVTSSSIPVLADGNFPDDARFRIDVTQIGDGTAKGLKLALLGRPTPVTVPDMPVIAQEANILAVNFADPDRPPWVVVKNAGVVTQFAADDFFANIGTTAKLVTGANGLLKWCPHNWFLNSEAPATQNVTLVVGETYTFSALGSGTITASSGASGVSTNAIPATFVATTATGVFTKAGTVTRIQLNRGTVMTPYLVTTATRRVGLSFEHDPVTHEQLGLLGGAAATNSLLWSRDLSNAAWTKTGMDAYRDQVGADGVAAYASRLQATAPNATCMQGYTAANVLRVTSAYVKRISGSGAVEMTQDNGVTWAPITVTADWVRVRIPTQLLTDPTVGFRLVTSGDEIGVDLVQSEQNILTGPIPTYSITAARIIDANIAMTSSFPFNNAAFTILLYGAQRSLTGNAMTLLSDGTNNERVLFDVGGAARVGNITVIDNNVSQVALGVIDLNDVDTFVSVVTGVQADNFAISTDGVPVWVDLVGTMPTLDRVTLGNGNSLIKGFAIIPRRMSNAELELWSKQFAYAWRPEVTIYDADEIVVIQKTVPNRIWVFTKGSNPETNKYIRWEYREYTSGAGGAELSNGWNMYSLYEVERLGDTLFSTGRWLTDSGQNWPVWFEDGQGGAGGNVHGNEYSDSPVMKIDGAVQAIDGVSIHRCISFNLLQHSIVKSMSDDTTPLVSYDWDAEHTKDGITFDVTATILTNHLLTTYYASMFSLSRYMDLDVTKPEVIENVARSPDFVWTDVDAVGADAINTAYHYKMDGPTSGISVEIEMTAGWTDPGRESFMQKASGSRKIYMAPLGIGITPPLAMTASTVITTTAKYRATTHN